MDLLSFWQFEFVSLATHKVQNLKRPKELCLQLLIVFDFDIFAIQPNRLTKSITSRLSFFLIGLFLQFLGMLQVFSAYSYEIPKFFGQLISYFRPGARVDVVFVRNIQMVSAVELERRVSRASIFCVIISESRHGQEPCLVILFVINEGFKVNFYCAILLLSLAVSLRLKSHSELLFDA